MPSSINHKNSWLRTIVPAFTVGGLAGFLIAGAIGRGLPLTGRGDDDGSGSLVAASTNLTVVPFNARVRPSTEQWRSGMSDVAVDFSVPLSKQYDRLKVAADRGDLRSVCKLIRSFEHCLKGSKEAEMIESLLDRAAKDSENDPHVSGVASEIEELQSRTQKAEWFCSDLPVDKDVELTRRTYQAAELGDLGAMVRFSTDPPLGQMTLANAEAVYLFTKEAPRILEKAVMRGDMNAIRSMFYAQTAGVLDTDYGSVPVDRNPAMLVATAHVLRAFADKQVRADVDEYLGSPPSDVMKIVSSSAVQQLQMQIRNAVLESDRGISESNSTASSRSRPVCE
jgi:hypothetical protein